MKTGNLAFIKELETLLNKYNICIVSTLSPGCAFRINSFDNMEVLEDYKKCDKKLSSIKISKKKDADNNYYYKIRIKDGSQRENENEMDI